MKKSELMNLIAKYPGWEYTYILQYERSASLRLIYRGHGLPRIPELDSITPDREYPVNVSNCSFDDYPDYRLDIPSSWEGDDLPGKLWAYSPN